MRVLYLLLIVATNIVTAVIEPLSIAGGALIVPTGSLFAGAVFVLRDMVQLKHGKSTAYTLILLATILSAGMSIAQGDVAHIAFASSAAFFLSESADTEIFSRLHQPLYTRIALSGIIGGLLDSTVFVVLGLSPIGTGVLPWGTVPAAVAGQILVKTCVQLIAAACLLLKTKHKRRQNASHEK